MNRCSMAISFRFLVGVSTLTMKSHHTCCSNLLLGSLFLYPCCFWVKTPSFAMQCLCVPAAQLRFDIKRNSLDSLLLQLRETHLTLHKCPTETLLFFHGVQFWGSINQSRLHIHHGEMTSKFHSSKATKFILPRRLCSLYSWPRLMEQASSKILVIVVSAHSSEETNETLLTTCFMWHAPYLLTMELVICPDTPSPGRAILWSPALRKQRSVHFH